MTQNHISTTTAVDDGACESNEQPLTAARRGPEWMTYWGCTPWCVEDHTDPVAAEWHTSIPVETEIRAANLDSNSYTAKDNDLPWLAARIVVSNYLPQAYGRKTQVWLDYGKQIAELSPAQARKALTEMQGFVAQLQAVVEQAEGIAADDFEGDPEIARLDREASDRRFKARTAELRTAKA
ncbi:DUF6907 domain-containing protein [Streptomyces graminilatus]|uniref:DUF6907 domain-containing protein n=1 Tax=Streptomyces graminilatus TaxID=1464070 RepID=UPI0006E3D42A|nr:hypothetical protein [Streptomyces graminilatus]